MRPDAILIRRANVEVRSELPTGPVLQKTEVILARGGESKRLLVTEGWTWDEFWGMLQSDGLLDSVIALIPQE